MSSRVFGRLKVVRVAQRHHALVHCRVASTKTSNWVHPVHQVDSMQSDKHEPLRTDVRFLGWALGSFIKSRDPATYEEVERLRELAKTCRMAGFGTPADQDALDKMAQAVRTLDPATLLSVSRAFTHFLALANTAEANHGLRLDRQTWGDQPLPSRENSTGGTIDKLLQHGVSSEEILASLSSQQVEIVLTAHPTEVNRRTLLTKHKHILEGLRARDSRETVGNEMQEIEDDIMRQVASIWDSDELRREAPTPVDEARKGLHIVEQVLWEALPRFLRKLDQTCQDKLGRRLPLDARPIKLASWMGGDRDGNPRVTPEVTTEVSMLSRWLCATLLRRDIAELRERLSVCSASSELSAATGGSSEPYRKVLHELEQRLDATIVWAGGHIKHPEACAASAGSELVNVPRSKELAVAIRSKMVLEGKNASTEGPQPIFSKHEVLDKLLLLHRSLLANGQENIADGELTDVIRRLSAFGMSLLPLDIRQESDRHSECLSAFTEELGLGTYEQWDEEQKLAWLTDELTNKRPLLNMKPGWEQSWTPTQVDTLATLHAASELPVESLGAYVISQARSASDVLAVMLLQKEAGMPKLMRVVPLFETLTDLTNSATVLDQLLGLPQYRDLCNGKQEIMVGYSDSAKDAGRLAAAWQQHEAQVAMAAVADKHGIEITFFHGKGGTVGRGGNPRLYDAILAHPPNTVRGRFRVTEQGEMITQNFGHVPIAERTVDIFTAGVLAEKFAVRQEVKPEWRDIMERMSDTSCQAYRNIVRGEPRFVPYFRAATPELELSGLNVGSRPAKRNPQGGVESLRAIPWVFSWTQTRLQLPVWLGVGEAFTEELSDPTRAEALKSMAQQWPWFDTVVNLVNLVLAKSDAEIAAIYDSRLLDKTDRESAVLGEELRSNLLQTRAVVHQLGDLGSDPHMGVGKFVAASLQVRNVYLDPLNVIQAEVLYRLRQAEADGAVKNKSETKLLRDALLVTINGIANGMRNSG